VPVLNFTLINEADNIIINATSNATTFQATFDYGSDSSNLMKKLPYQYLRSLQVHDAVQH